jgi:hypothetical protein
VHFVVYFGVWLAARLYVRQNADVLLGRAG